jgi:hypothetical protein
MPLLAQMTPTSTLDNILPAIRAAPREWLRRALLTSIRHTMGNNHL